MVAASKLDLPQTKRIKIDVEPDDIPEEVVDIILSFLPIKKHFTLRTLSKSHLDVWKSCRNLSFDSDFAKNLSREACKIIINKFFDDHTSTCADVFKLCYDATNEHELVSTWVSNAILLGIKELELDLVKAKNDQPIPCLHYELVDGKGLEIMRLVNCDLYLPLSSNGLRFLRELSLQGVEATPELTNSIFVNCLSLRELRLAKCSMVLTLRAFTPENKGFRSLVVKDCTEVQAIVTDSPLLRRFHYRGKMTRIKFCTEMRHLSDVIIDIAQPRSYELFSNRDELIHRLAFVEILTVSSIFLEGLCPRYHGNEYKKVEFCLPKLKEFHLIVESESIVTASDVAKFIDTCPIIEKIFIDIGRYAFGDSYYWRNFGIPYMNEWKKIFPFLQYVKIKGFTNKEVHMHMAKFFLKNATNLRSLILVKARTHSFPKVYYNPHNIGTDVIYNAQIEMYSSRGDKDTTLPKQVRNVV